MRVKTGKLADWANMCAINYIDPYSHCVMEFTDEWANEMEKHLDNGETIEQCADRTFKEVDN